MSKRYTTVRFQPGQVSAMLCPMCGYEYVRIIDVERWENRQGPSFEMRGVCEDDCEFTIAVLFEGGRTDMELVHGTTWNDRVAAKGTK